jgi:hypothetical protein
MKIIIILKIILHHINFVKIIIIRPKNQNWYPKSNVPYFWNNYIICIIILDPKMPQRVTVMCFHLIGKKHGFFNNNILVKLSVESKIIA